MSCPLSGTPSLSASLDEVGVLLEATLETDGTELAGTELAGAVLVGAVLEVAALELGSTAGAALQAYSAAIAQIDATPCKAFERVQRWSFNISIPLLTQSHID